ncbi:hypothetical protein DFH08DRAFT_823786 [Mycena albidolilacea]|uniref:Uncharacterized protein n=1 Tax=Mycena albidolilacea TaxID=1033008 RepID=A0AAD7EB34_9AGAR|nr:hypothetical protein DFH08DRAFT_823786 [Mycena albidolilacea]
MFSNTFQLFSPALAFLFSPEVDFIQYCRELTETPLPAVTILSVPPFVGDQIDPIDRSSALPAVVLGIDSQGRMTYAFEQDGKIGSTTFPTTATLVQGADYASYYFSAFAGGFEVDLGMDCDLKGRGANCSVTRSNSPVATLTLTPLKPLVIDIVSTALPSATGKPNSSPGLSASRSGALVGVVVLVAHCNLIRYIRASS